MESKKFEIGTYENPISHVYGEGVLSLGLYYISTCKGCDRQFRWKYSDKSKNRGRLFCGPSCVYVNQLREARDSFPMELTLGIIDMSKIIYAYRIHGESPVDIAIRMGLELNQVKLFLGLPNVQTMFTLWNRPPRPKYVNVYDLSLNKIESVDPETPAELEQEVQESLPETPKERKKQHNLTQEERRLIIERNKNGFSIADIAKEFNASESNVRHLIRMSRLADKANLISDAQAIEPKKGDKDFLKRISQFFYRSEV